jgi:multicomponent Na+:H+ antiporter subunit B
MTGDVSIIFYVLALAAAIVALKIRDLLAAAVMLSMFSFLMALLYISLGAVDVGFNEAVLGAGVTGVLLVVAIFNTHRRSQD